MKLYSKIMKSILIFIVFSIVATYSAASSSDIIWEKTFSAEKLGNALARSITLQDSNIVLLYSGYLPKILSYHTGMIITGLDGKLYKQNEFSDRAEILSSNILKRDNSYYLYYQYYYNEQYRPSVLKTDVNGIIENDYKDTNSIQNYPTSSFVSSNDSIYSIGMNTDSLFFLNVYDDTLGLIRCIELEYNNEIDDTINRLSAMDCSISNNHNIFSIFTGPNLSNIYSGKFSYLFRHDYSGRLLWSIPIVHPQHDTTIMYNIGFSEEEDVYISGYGKGPNSEKYILLYKFNTDGYEIWNKSCKIDLDAQENVRGFKFLPQSKVFAIFGSLYDTDNYKRNCLWLFNNNGELITKKVWNHTRGHIEGLVETKSGEIVIFGNYFPNDLYLAKLSIESLNINDINYMPLSITISPNPVTDLCEIKLNNIQALNLEIAIYDIFGNKVKEVSNEPALAPQKSFIVNLSGLAPGSYFVSVYAGGTLIRKKILKI